MGCFLPIALALLMAIPTMAKADELPPSVFVERQTDCVDEATLRASLEHALGAYRRSLHMMIAVVIAPFEK